MISNTIMTRDIQTSLRDVQTAVDHGVCGITRGEGQEDMEVGLDRCTL
jgi:hypothetical protein